MTRRTGNPLKADRGVALLTGRERVERSRPELPKRQGSRRVSGFNWTKTASDALIENMIRLEDVIETLHHPQTERPGSKPGHVIRERGMIGVVLAGDLVCAVHRR